MGYFALTIILLSGMTPSPFPRFARFVPSLLLSSRQYGKENFIILSLAKPVT